MLSLRPYQAEAVSLMMDAVRQNEHPVASLPTGSGKSVVCAGLVSRLRESGMKRIVVTVPSRELAEQNERALRLALPAEDVGVVCAALGRREVLRDVIIGTPQSLSRLVDFQPDAVVVDECHQMPLHKGSHFARLFAGFPDGMKTRRLGLSATTFRTADGAVFGRGKKAWFTVQPYEMGVADLVDMGFLAPVRYVAPEIVMTVRGVKKTTGDYNQAELVKANIDQVSTQVRIIRDALATRRRAMIFAVTVEHARAYAEELEASGEPAALIVGALSARDRAAEVAAFKDGSKRVAVTVAAALTGFDVPEIDLLASCRPTMSPIIHTQSIGRGTRPVAGKDDCLVLDFAGNVPRFGPVHQPHFDKSGQPLGGMAPWRPCGECGTYNHFSAEECGHCGTVLRVRRVVTAQDLEFGTINWRRESQAMALLTHERGTTGLTVESLALHAYRKKHEPHKVSLMLSLGLGGDAVVRLWFRPVAKNRHFAAIWSRLLGDSPVPQTVEEAYARRDELVRPGSLDLYLYGNFWKVQGVSYEDDEEEQAEAA